MLEIRLLGHFDLQLSGEACRLPSRQAQALLANLLLNPNRHQRREKLAGMMWPELVEEKARSRLRYALWQLRKAIGEEYVLADKISIGINRVLPIWFDVAIIDNVDPVELPLAELSRSLDLYDGELLPGFYDDWVILERERLVATFDNKVGILVSRLAAGRRWREVIDWVERWIALGHVPEPAYRALMVAYSQLGDNAGALLAFQRCKQTLHDQLAVEPSAETQQLLLTIKSGDLPGYQAPESDEFRQPTISDRQPDLPFVLENGAQNSPAEQLFVARDQELAWLSGNLDQTLDGHGRVVFVRGDAGRGKTTLLREFCDRSLDRIDKLVVSWGNGEAHTGQGDPHLPFRDVLTLLTGDVENSILKGEIPLAGAQRIWRILPSVVEILLSLGPDLIGTFVPGNRIADRAKLHTPGGAAWSDRLASHLQVRGQRPVPLNVQHRDLAKDIFEQYTRVLQRIASQRPLLIILDDLHWADSGSIQLLFHLGRRIESQPIMIVGGYRPAAVAQVQDGETHPLINVLVELSRKFGDSQLDLDQASEHAGRQFSDAILDAEPNRYGDDFRQTFFRHTGGHPLFTIELLRQMQAAGDVRQDESGVWITGDVVGWSVVPVRVEAVIAGRINQLPAPLKDILRIASVEGENFTAEVIAAVYGITIPNLIRQLSHELAQQHQLVYATATRYNGRQRLSTYRFRHHLFQQHIYDSLDPVERAHIHEAVGRTLEKLYNQHTEAIAIQLAWHFEEAGIIDKGIQYQLQAGEIAKRLSANEEAIGHFRKGLDLLPLMAGSEDKSSVELALRINLGAPLVALKGYTSPEVESTFARARALCEEVNDPAQLATTLWGLWSFYLVLGQHETAKELAKQIDGLARSTGDSSLVIAANWTLGITLLHLGHFSEARSKLDLVIDHYDPGRHGHLTYLYGQNPLVTCQIYAAYAYWFLGYLEQALDLSHSALVMAEEIDHPYSSCFAQGMVAIFHGIRRDPQEALHHAQSATKLAKSAGFPFILGLGLVMRGWARAEMDKESMTIRQVRAGLEAMELVGAALGRPLFLSFLSETLTKSGKNQEALVVIKQAHTLAVKNGERFFEADLVRLRGRLLGRQSGAAQVEEACYLEALNIARHQQSQTLALRALIDLYEFGVEYGQEEVAREELRSCYEWFSDAKDTADLVKARQILEL